MNKKRVFSGIKPSGDLHIGNYLGAIKGWVDNQEQNENIFCVVDLHAITVPQNSEDLKRRIKEIVKLYIASGINPKDSNIFVQSHISAHSELAWILNCFTPMGWLEKMTQFKEKSEGMKERVSAGLFNYPVLMASDILLYDTEEVPVGEDQAQHVELARDVAKRFNSMYEKDIFTIPKVILDKENARTKGLQNPEKKMSKSDDGSVNNLVYLLDEPNEIRKKIMSAQTDSFNEVAFDKERPGIYNLLTIYESFSGLPAQAGESRGDIETKFEGKGYGDFKKDLAELVVEGLRPIQEKYKELTQDESYIDEILKNGAEKIRPMAEKKLEEVKNIIGLG